MSNLFFYCYTAICLVALFTVLAICLFYHLAAMKKLNNKRREMSGNREKLL